MVKGRAVCCQDGCVLLGAGSKGDRGVVELLVLRAGGVEQVLGLNTEVEQVRQHNGLLLMTFALLLLMLMLPLALKPLA